jgi:hypothetical protein
MSMHREGDRTGAPGGVSPPSGQDDAHLDALLADTLAERATEIAPAPDALPRLNARLDQLRSGRPWWMGRLRWAGAIAVALLLFAVVTPVGRLAAAGLANATRAIIVTVKEIATGDDGGGKAPTTPASVPSTGSGSAVATAPAGSSTRPSGSATTEATVPGTAVGTPRGTTTGTAVGTSIATSTATAAPTSIPTAAPTEPVQVPGALTGTSATASPTAIPTTPTAGVPTTRAPATPPPTPSPTGAPSGNRGGAPVGAAGVTVHGNGPATAGKDNPAAKKEKEKRDETGPKNNPPPAKGKDPTA